MAEIKAESDHDNRQPDGNRDRDQSTCSHTGSKRSSPSECHRAFLRWLVAGNKVAQQGCGS